MEKRQAAGVGNLLLLPVVKYCRAILRDAISTVAFVEVTTTSYLLDTGLTAAMVAVAV